MSTFVKQLSDVLRQDFMVDPRLLAPASFRGGPGRPLSQAILALQQVGQLLKLRPSVVHTHEHPVLLGAALTYRLLSRRPVRVVHTIHVDPAEKRALWKRVVYGWLLGPWTVVTAVSHDTATHLDNVSLPVPADVKVIRGGAQVRVKSRTDPGVLAFAARLGLAEGPILTQIGPFNTQRKVAGVMCLVAALGQVRLRFPEIRLLLVGDGCLRSQLERATVQAGVADSVIVTGFVDDVSVPLALSDVYCQITFQDACPLALLEAMHAAKPIVASRTGGIPEIISDGVDGLLVDRDPTHIANAIIRLLEQPQLARSLAAHAATTGRTEFTWDRAAAEFAAVYRAPPRSRAVRAN